MVVSTATTANSRATKRGSAARRGAMSAPASSVPAVPASRCIEPSTPPACARVMWCER